MRCPYCGFLEDRVIDSRPADDGLTVRRRRECASCHERFTTYERVENIPLMVIKKDGRRQPFDSSKLIAGIIKSCEKRPVRVAQIEQLVSEIEEQQENSLKREVTTKQLGEIVLEKLRDIDDVAYIRFASVYREFDDMRSFLSEMNNLMRDEIKNENKE